MGRPVGNPAGWFYLGADFCGILRERTRALTEEL